jgi:hypothetical protein
MRNTSAAAFCVMIWQYLNMAYSKRYETRDDCSAQGMFSCRRPWVGQRISRGKNSSQIVQRHTVRSLQRRGSGRVRTIFPRLPHSGHRHPFLWGLTCTIRFHRPQKLKPTTRSLLNLSSFVSNLFPVIDPPPYLLVLVGRPTKNKEGSMTLQLPAAFHEFTLGNPD